MFRKKLTLPALEHNELLDAFSELRVLYYREVDINNKAFASLIALKENES